MKAMKTAKTVVLPLEAKQRHNVTMVQPAGWDDMDSRESPKRWKPRTSQFYEKYWLVVWNIWHINGDLMVINPLVMEY